MSHMTCMDTKIYSSITVLLMSHMKGLFKMQDTKNCFWH